MRAWIFYIMAIIMALYASSVRADDAPSEDYSAEDKKRDLDNAAKCKTLSDGFHKLENGAACFNGLIDSKNIMDPKIAIDDGKVETLYINSLGGVTTAAMELGRSIYAKNIKLVLHQVCFSSCANYLPIASGKLVVLKGTIFGLHGSVFRDVNDYIRGSQAYQKAPKNSQEQSDIFLSLLESYPKFYREQTVAESLYFVDIEITEQYVTRRNEINQNRKLYDNGKCGEIPTTALMVGPKYFDRYYYGKILFFDWDEEAIKQNPLFDEIFSPQFSIVFDDSLFPTMTPERGEINPLECFTLK